MLKAKPPRSTKEMTQAMKEVTKEEVTQIHCLVPTRIRWRLKEYLLSEGKKRGCKYTYHQWFIEQVESLPDPSDK